MKEKDKNNKSEPAGFLRYAKGEMTDRERNDFERELQKDPFAEEAAEGFSEISPAEAESDLMKISKKLQTRVTHRQRMVYYRIAASAAVLMVLSSVFIILNKRTLSEKLSEIPEESVVFEISESEAIKEPKVQETSENNMHATENITKKKSEPQVLEKISEEIRSETEIKLQVSERLEIISGADAKASDIFVVQNQAAAPVAAAPSKTSADAKELNKNGIRPDTGLEEVVVVGYGAAQKSDNEMTGYSPPTPAEGKSVFEDYIRENIRKPGILKEGERAVVVVRFIVQSNGIIDSIEVIRSPSRPFSDEAMRLIKEGPAWKPAIENGKTINDKVKIKISF